MSIVFTPMYGSYIPLNVWNFFNMRHEERDQMKNKIPLCAGKNG